MAETTMQRLQLTDAVLAIVCVPPTIVGALSKHGSFGIFDVAVIVVSVALILLRRRAPIPVLAAGIVALVGSIAVMGRPNGLIPVVIVLVFTVAVRYERRISIYAGIAALLGLLATVAILTPHGLFGPQLLAAVAWPALAVAAGDVIRGRQVAIAAAEERARRAEETREEEARRRVVEERLHIAREVHDVVAHRIAVVNVQAGVAEHLLRSRPDDAAAALRVVRSSAQAALDELGGIVDVLRTAGETDASAEPAPTLTQLAALVDSYRNAGLAVEYETSGAPRVVADTTQLALYRTVQEGLTNAHRYGDGRVRVSIRHAADGVDVEMENLLGAPAVGDAAPTEAAARPGGFGLIGMRERVLAAGGSLQVGPEGANRFAIRAHFPNAEAPS